MIIIDVASGKEIKKEVEELEWDEKEEAIACGHYMLKEILEQPRSILRAIEQDDKELINAALEILRARDVIFTACGTSRYAAIIGRYLLSKIASKFSDVIIASEFQYFADSIDRNTLVIAISQSGETADVLEGVKKAKEKNAKIIGITNARNSSLAKIADKVFYLNCGPEVAVAATKSFTSQLAILYLFAFASVNKIPKGKEKLKEIATKLKNKENFYYIARGIDFAIASEGALKLKEISYAHAEGMPAGELKHGTLSLIEKDTPVIVICPKDYTYEETINNAIEAKARGGFIIGVSDERNEIFDYWIKIPKVEEIFYPIVSVVPLQLFAYYLAVARGNNPDKPRNLAKSVTVL